MPLVDLGCTLGNAIKRWLYITERKLVSVAHVLEIFSEHTIFSALKIGSVLLLTMKTLYI